MNLGNVLLILTTALPVYGYEDEEKCFAQGCGGKVMALVPARSGSKGIERKNLSRIGNDTLVGRTLKMIRQSGQFDSIWVSTDDREIADEAWSNGANVHWRDPLTATDNATTLSAIKDFLQFHEGEFVRPLNFDPGNRPRRQDWTGELSENGMFYFFKKELVTKKGVIQNNRCKIFEIAKEFSLEIDTPRDLKIARKISELIDNETRIQN